MTYLLDSNLLIRQFDLASPQRAEAVAAIEVLIQRKEDIVVFPQVLIEFWAVVTRPVNVNGLGWTTSQAESAIKNLPSSIKLVLDTSAIFDQWLKLVIDFGVLGKNVHDARIVAAMLVHGVTSVLTFNEEDF